PLAGGRFIERSTRLMQARQPPNPRTPAGTRSDRESTNAGVAPFTNPVQIGGRKFWKIFDSGLFVGRRRLSGDHPRPAGNHRRSPGSHPSSSADRPCSPPTTARVLPATARVFPTTIRVLPAPPRLLPATAPVLPTADRVLPATTHILPATGRVLPATPRRLSTRESATKGVLGEWHLYAVGQYAPKPPGLASLFVRSRAYQMSVTLPATVKLLPLWTWI